MNVVPEAFIEMIDEDCIRVRSVRRIRRREVFGVPHDRGKAHLVQPAIEIVPRALVELLGADDQIGIVGVVRDVIVHVADITGKPLSGGVQLAVDEDLHPAVQAACDGHVVPGAVGHYDVAEDGMTFVGDAVPGSEGDAAALQRHAVFANPIVVENAAIEDDVAECPIFVDRFLWFSCVIARPGFQPPFDGEIRVSDIRGWPGIAVRRIVDGYLQAIPVVIGGELQKVAVNPVVETHGVAAFHWQQEREVAYFVEAEQDFVPGYTGFGQISGFVLAHAFPVDFRWTHAEVGTIKGAKQIPSAHQAPVPGFVNRLVRALVFVIRVVHLIAGAVVNVRVGPFPPDGDVGPGVHLRRHGAGAQGFVLPEEIPLVGKDVLYVVFEIDNLHGVGPG